MKIKTQRLFYYEKNFVIKSLDLFEEDNNEK